MTAPEAFWLGVFAMWIAMWIRHLETKRKQ